MRKRIHLYLVLLFFLVDYLSKLLIRTFLGNNVLIIIKDFFVLNYVKNYGAAFSILTNQRLLLIIISILTLGLIYKVFYNENNIFLENFALSMTVGGVIGNLYDRIFFGFIHDFLSFSFLKYNFPIFNFADSFIVIGVILLIIINLRSEHEKNNS